MNTKTHNNYVIAQFALELSCPDPTRSLVHYLLFPMFMRALLIYIFIAPTAANHSLQKL